MPTYEYECLKCGLRFERRQSMTDRPLAACPECKGEVRRLISGGVGFIVKGSGHDRTGRGGSACSLEQSGQTCCGRVERCGKPPCGGEK
ncbi:MAG: zinc ribbon domain-containing protein [Acidobacteriota bacterium]|nr:zinc ribbon domain-containing protein [Acidobacteriota bacterium]